MKKITLMSTLVLASLAVTTSVLADEAAPQNTSATNVGPTVSAVATPAEDEKTVTPENGYTETSTTKITETPQGCDTVVKKETDTNYQFEAESVMDNTIPDYSNNGYTKKTINENNHSVNDQNAGLQGPGNAEVQHWQTAKENNTYIKQQNWRFVYAQDFAGKDVQVKVTLPYEVKANDLTNVTDWLLTRYYPAVVGKNVYKPIDLDFSKAVFENNVLTLSLGDVDPYSAFAFIVTHNFKNPAQGVFKANMIVTGMRHAEEEFIKEGMCPKEDNTNPVNPNKEKPTTPGVVNPKVDTLKTVAFTNTTTSNKDKMKEEAKTSKVSELPKTGDQNSSYYLIAIALFALIAVLVFAI